MMSLFASAYPYNVSEFEELIFVIFGFCVVPKLLSGATALYEHWPP
jgi:hypothetical protein